MRGHNRIGLALLVVGWVALLGATVATADVADRRLNRELRSALTQAEFTGRVEASLERRLGRAINPRLAGVGRMLWFDPITGLNNDNSCAGCHSCPARASIPP